MRLNKYLASAGVASRRKCDDLIRGGKVHINSCKILEPWFEVDPSSDMVEVDGKPIEPPVSRVYLLLNKPRGVITTVVDPHGRPTVVSLLENAYSDRRVCPVGRLDADTTGALLLTDDGELTYRLTHPKYESVKEYLVRLKEAVSGDHIRRLQWGLELEDGPIKPDSVKRLDPYRIEITLHEGRKRIIRRMFESLGYTVLELHRTKFAGLSADDLLPGSWRELNSGEIQELRTSVGIESIT